MVVYLVLPSFTEFFLRVSCILSEIYRVLPSFFRFLRLRWGVESVYLVLPSFLGSVVLSSIIHRRVWSFRVHFSYLFQLKKQQKTKLFVKKKFYRRKGFPGFGPGFYRVFIESVHVGVGLFFFFFGLALGGGGGARGGVAWALRWMRRVRRGGSIEFKGK